MGRSANVTLTEIKAFILEGTGDPKRIDGAITRLESKGASNVDKYREAFNKRVAESFPEYKKGKGHVSLLNQIEVSDVDDLDAFLAE